MLTFSAPLWPPSVVGVSYKHVVVVVVVVAAAAAVVLHAFHVVDPLSFDNLDAFLDADEHVPVNLSLPNYVINKID